jgi:hypothetical protein
MSEREVWLQLSALEGVSQDEIERVASFEDATIVRDASGGPNPTRILCEAIGDHEEVIESGSATVLNGAALRAMYGLRFTREQRFERAKAWVESGVEYYSRWPAVLNLMVGTDDERERQSLADYAREAMAELDPEERWVSNAAMNEAIAGRPAIASAGDFFWIDPVKNLEHARWLGEDPARLPNLRWIKLHGNAEGVREALRLLGQRAIDRVSFTGGSIGPDVAALIDALPSGTRGVNFFYCQQGPKLFQALAKSALWPTLERVELHNNDGKTKGLKSLISAKGNKAMRSLDLGYNHLKSEDFTALSKAAWLPEVRSLALKFNDALAQGASALLSSPALAKLESLDFGANEIGDPGVVALCNNPAITALTKLTIEGNHQPPLVTAEGARALAQWDCAATLSTLNLGMNAIGDDGLVALLSSQRLASVQTLDVQYNSLTVGAAASLAGVETPVRPRRVVLSGNALGTAGYGSKPKAPNKKRPASPWSDARWLSECRSLVLYNTSLDADTFAAIVSSPALAKVASLDVSSNYGLSNDALEFLFAQPLARRLTALEAMYWPWKKGAADLLLSAPFADTIFKLAISKKGLATSEVAALRLRYGSRISLS